MITTRFKGVEYRVKKYNFIFGKDKALVMFPATFQTIDEAQNTMEPDITRISVCLDKEVMESLSKDEFIIKNWSENESLYKHLISEGILVETGRAIPTGFVIAPVCRLVGDDA